MGRRGFPRVDIRDAWELAGGEGGHLGEGYQVFRNQHLEACVCVCVWVGGCGLGPGGGGTGVSDQRVDVYSVDSTGSTALPIFERE